MRKNRWWVPISLAACGAFACSPHVSVGDLGADGGRDSLGASGAMSAGRSGTALMSDGGATAVDPTPLTPTGGASGEPIGGSPATAGAPMQIGDSMGGSPGTAGAPMTQGGSSGGLGMATAGANALPPGCPADLRQVAPAPTADCPDALPAESNAACDWTENAICVWQDSPTEAGFTALGCYASLMGKTSYGVGQGSFGNVGVNNDQCPKIAPVPDTSCAMHAGQHCYYPLEDCACAASDGNWQCKTNIKPASPPIVVKRLCAPMGIEETKQLGQLSDEEVLAWCNWYGDPSGAPRPTVSLQDPPETARTYASLYTEAGVKACILDLPAELCVKNIRTQAACTATLAELDDCVETVRAAGNGFGGWVGHGCAPLMANPTCSRVIAQPINPEHPTLCEVPLQ